MTQENKFAIVIGFALLLARAFALARLTHTAGCLCPSTMRAMAVLGSLTSTAPTLAGATGTIFLAFSRPPEVAELEDCVALIEGHGLVTLCRALINSNEFLFIP